MKIKFTDIIKFNRKVCKDCFILIYSTPCIIKRDIIEYMKSFGEPKFDLDVIDLLYIESPDNYIIKCKMGSNYISFSLPRELEHTDLSKSRKSEFEDNIKEWLRNILKISII